MESPQASVTSSYQVSPTPRSKVHGQGRRAKFHTPTDRLRDPQGRRLRGEPAAQDPERDFLTPIRVGKMLRLNP